MYVVDDTIYQRNKESEGRIMVFQQYFSYIVVVSFIGGKTRENHRPVVSHRQTLSHNVVLSRPHNVSGDRL